MRVFWIPVFGLITLLFATLAYAGVTDAVPPKIAFYTLTPAIQTPQWDSVATSLSALLSIKLGESDKLELLDRSLILDVFGEKTLPMQQSSSVSNGLMLDKVPVSDYIVTGSLLNAGQEAAVALKVVDSESGRIIASTRHPFSPDNISILVEQLDRFIHTTIGTRAREEKKAKRTLGIGNFVNISQSDIGAGRGDEIREYLIDHYLGKTDLKVLMRAQVYPLVLEAHLKRLQYTSGTKKQERPTTPLYIHGRYQVTGRGPDTQIHLYLYLDLIGTKRVSRTITASSWEDIYRKLNEVMDDAIQINPTPVADADIIRSERFYQDGIKTANFYSGPSARINGKTWSYPGLSWGENQQLNSDSAITKLETAVSINPNYDEPRVALAFCLLHTGQEIKAYRYLERVLLNTENRTLLDIVERLLRKRPITADRLEGISEDSKKLYDVLVAGLYIEKDGDDLFGLRVIDSAADIDLPAYTLRQREMVFQVTNPRWSPPNRKNLFNGKKYNRETEYHFYLGQWRSHIIYTGSNVRLPNVDTSGIHSVAPDQQSIGNLRAAFDEYSTALFLDGEFYAAMTYLAHVMRTQTIRQYSHANMWFDYVTRNSADDNWKFLAADAINKIEDTNFTEFFSSFHNLDRHQVKKRKHEIPNKRVPVNQTTEQEDAARDRAGLSPDQIVALKPFQQQENNPRTFIGGSVALDNDYAIIGAKLAKTRGWYGSEAGAVTIYQNVDGKWSHATKLSGEKPVSTRSRDWFGASVDMYGDYAIVGAPLDDDEGPLLTEYFPADGIGERYQARGLIEKLFENGYLDVYGHATNKFSGVTDGLQADFPGLTENDIDQLANAVRKSMDLKDSGTAHVFRKVGNNWKKEGKLFASDAKAKINFGVDVAIHNEQSLVCATGIYEDESTIKSYTNTFGGGAYLFGKIQGRWVEETKLVTAKCKAVALDGEWAMVGVRRPDSPSGTVYVFRKVDGSWEKFQELVADDFTSSGNGFLTYGSTLALSGDYVVIGNPFDDLGDSEKWPRTGSAYVFKYEGGQWKQTQKLERRFNSGKFGKFGMAVSLSGKRLLIGASYASGRLEHADAAGKAYIFKLKDSYWNFVEELSPVMDIAYENFGAAVAVGRQSTLVGAPGPNGLGKVYFHP